jgi:two-component system OmpR family response regulator
MPNCLVIEDDAETRDYICDGLRTAGYAVTGSDNGTDAQRPRARHALGRDRAGPHAARPTRRDRAARADARARRHYPGTDPERPEQHRRARASACAPAATTTSPSRSHFPNCWRGSKTCGAAPPGRASNAAPASGRPAARRAHHARHARARRSPAAARIPPARIPDAPRRPVVTRTMLLEGVWDYQFDPQTNVIDVQISRLRSKIDKDFSPALIHTVRGVGYMLAASPRAMFRTRFSLRGSIAARLALGYGLLLRWRPGPGRADLLYRHGGRARAFNRPANHVHCREHGRDPARSRERASWNARSISPSCMTASTATPR